MTTNQALIRTVLADDHDLVRSGLKVLLERIEGLRVVAEASSGDELLALIDRVKPDLVVTDITMRGMDGLTALSQVRGMAPVIVLSMHDSPDFIRRAYRLGAAAYLMKEGSAIELEQAVHQVLAGHVYYSPKISERLLLTSERPPEDLLTERQIQILVMIGRGQASKEIAFDLGLSSKTVDVHRARIMERLNIDDTVGLALYCVRHGLVDPQRAAGS